MNSAELGMPTLEADIDDSDWTSELETGIADSAMKFGRREWKPYPLAKRILTSRKLLRCAALPVESIIRDRMGYKFAVTMEKAYLTGTGVAQPLGVFTASANGVTTARDVSTGNTATAFTVDGLMNALYSLREPYRRSPKVAWILHRDAVKLARQLKDGMGRYLWEAGIGAQNEPDRLLGKPVYESEYAPNTFSASSYVGIVGDMSYYYIADSLALEIQTLLELKAETNQIEHIGRLESDGMPVMAEAFARVKLGT
jgi:HK97 family phage major capsid protein